MKYIVIITVGIKDFYASIEAKNNNDAAIKAIKKITKNNEWDVNTKDFSVEIKKVERD